jgi:hypothetical protein
MPIFSADHHHEGELDDQKFLETFKDGGDAEALKNYLLGQAGYGNFYSLRFKLSIYYTHKGYAARILEVIQNNSDIFGEFISRYPNFLSQLQEITNEQTES